jgi:excisionase family DNA binding protein
MSGISNQPTRAAPDIHQLNHRPISFWGILKPINRQHRGDITMNNDEWISLRDAADILGVHPATVRNWADKGDLPARRTPGGHRRFRRSDLLNYAATQGEIQPTEVQVILQSALGQARMQVGTLTQLPWYAAMSDATRSEMRLQGRRVLEELRHYLAHGAPHDELSHAITLGKDYAQVLNRDGLTLPQAVRGFFYFSDFVINSVLTWSELNQPRSSSDWGALLRHINTFIHAMLLSIVEYYEED